MTEEPPSVSSPSGDHAERIYAEFRSRLDDGGGVDLESLCHAHPEFAARLRVLDAEWRRIQDLLGGGLESTGAHAGLEASTAGEAFTSEILERLARHRRRDDRYRFEGQIARGGMGAILRVWDEDLRRTLAMKVVLGSERSDTPTPVEHTDPKLLSRFLEEAQVTGQLDHPGIVPVHELGLDEHGAVYFTMRLVQGRELRSLIELVHAGEEGWNLTRALTVMQKVCEAMAYAHTKGVIHRDLKPANVMVGRFGEVYVMDWGLAHVLGEEDRRDLRLRTDDPLTDRSLHSERRDHAEATPDGSLWTMDGDVVGTPAYMSPEQARGEVSDLDARTDVYAVGAMLYHLLTNQAPFTPPGAKVSPHTVLMRVLEGPPLPVQELGDDAPVELTSICEKAMAREKDERYADMLSLAEDLRAFLEGRVVRAYQTGAVAEFRKWVQRNRLLAASLAALLFLTLGGSIGFAFYERSDARRFETQKGIAEVNEQKALDALKSGEGMRLLALAQHELERDPDLALLLAIEGAGHRPGREANELLVACLREAGLLPEFDAGEVSVATFTPDGERLLTGTKGGTIHVWDFESGRRLADLDGPSGCVLEVTCSPGSEHAAGIIGDKLVVWNLSRGMVPWVIMPPSGPFETYFEPGGKLLTMRNARGFRRSWEVETRREVPPPEVTEVEGEAPLASPDGRLLVVMPSGASAYVVAAETGARIFEFPVESGGLTAAAFSPTSDRLAAVTGSGTLNIWRTATWEVEHALVAHDRAFRHAAFSPDGRWILTTSFEVHSLQHPGIRISRTGITLWDVDAGTQWMTVEPEDPLRHTIAARFSPDGEFVVIAEEDEPVLGVPLMLLDYALRGRVRELLPSERLFYEVDRLELLAAGVEVGE